MASIEKRARGDGTVAFRVVWRDPTQPGRQSLTFDDRRQAEQTVKLLDANGQRLTLAVEVANAIRQGGPTVEDVVREHIELLNRVGEDTRTGYRLRARDHITPHIGALPVKALTWQQVTLWIRELQKKGLSHKSIANVHGLLSASMNTAVRPAGGQISESVDNAWDGWPATIGGRSRRPGQPWPAATDRLGS